MCTRFSIKNNKKLSNPLLTARNMDWALRFNTNIWAFPAGVKRNSMPEGEGGFSWISKFKSLSTCATTIEVEKDQPHIGSASDGINEKGLVVNCLWQEEADYGKFEPGDNKISMGVLVQYFLDNYATVDEVIKDWGQNYYFINTFTLPDALGEHRESLLEHIAMTDESGKIAILEYYKGKDDDGVKLHITTNTYPFIELHKKVKIHYQEDCAVTTNSPIYEEQVKINYYWKWIWEKSGNPKEQEANERAKLHALPGTNNPADRFIRVSHFLNHLNHKENYNEWIGQTLSVLRTASVPNGYALNNGESIVSSTVWSIVADHKNKRLFFQSTLSPALLWVNLDELDLSDNNYLLYLPINDKLINPYEHAGNETKNMVRKKIDHFTFLLDSEGVPEQQVNI